MNRILLADESPHAQRMGEQILREEGYTVESVSDGEAALEKIREFDPDVVLADIALPRRSGYDLCRALKELEGFAHVRCVLTAGLLKHVDLEEAQKAGSDGFLRKPFEASALLEIIRPLAASAVAARPSSRPAAPEPDLERERVGAAVTLALDEAMPRLIDEITARVLDALKNPR